MGKRFAIVIGVAASGVMALGAQTVMAQTAAEAPGVVEYPTKLTITTERCCLIHGDLRSGIPGTAGSSGIPVRECEDGREVILFKKRPGADRRLATTLSVFRALDPVAAPDYGPGDWGVPPGVGRRAAANHARVYAKVTPKVGDGFVCLGDLTTVLIGTEFGLMHKSEIRKFKLWCASRATACEPTPDNG
jgi:hypothetical protein